MRQLLLFQQRYRHLELQRLELQEPVFKRRPPERVPLNHAEHGLKLQLTVEHALAAIEAQPRPSGIDLARILRVQLTNPVAPDYWRRAGLMTLRTESNKALVVFSSDAEMAMFREQIAEYQAGQISRRKQQRPDHSWVEAIASFGPPNSDDRCGRLLRDQLAQGAFDADRLYRLDVELWNLGKEAAQLYALGQVEDFVRSRNGRITDREVPSDPLGLVQARVLIPGGAIGELLTIDWIAQVELPPSGGYALVDIRATSEANLGRVTPPLIDAPRLGILDSGLARDHPALRQMIGETFAVPPELGMEGQQHRHGTAVAGLAAYGDVGDCRRSGAFDASVWIDAAQVTNARNEFDSDLLITRQMREAITRLVKGGCRVINLSLGDPRLPYNDKKLSPWAETLDNLAHDLDIVIVVSAGNYDHRHQEGVVPRDLLKDYPRYLLADSARIIEPATAANVLTVGALASSGRPARAQWRRNADRRAPTPLAGPDEPSPFTRSGFGLGGMIKPDLVEYGGNWSYDADPDKDCIHEDSGLGVVTLNHNFQDGKLLAIDHGTSLAAPRVAHLAARVLATYPGASANLIRALLTHSATVPSTGKRLGLSAKERLRLYGYGRPDLERALYSTENRVVMMAEQVIDTDHFHVFEIPVPALLRETRGERSIAVTLAFDPPVRRNADYLGSTMDFRLLRGLTLGQIVSIFRAPDQDQQKAGLQRPYNCSMDPGSSHRDAGTLQHAVWSIMRSSMLNYDEPLYLVVSNKRGWIREAMTQRYALVVSLEHHTRPILLYTALHQSRLATQLWAS